jgi:NADH:ubiquinone oxidoreductase subunit 6 (subunit J)
VGFLLQAGPAPAPVAKAAEGDPTATLAQAFLGAYALPFELLAVLLVGALLGALYFARED